MGNNLNIKLINPAVHSKYSPNLYKWLFRNKIQRLYAQVYSDSDNILWIGYIDNGDFIGTRLYHALCEGAKAKTACYISIKLTLVENFWQEYLRIGRCAIDKDHSRYFLGDDRWNETDSNSRTCLWCGRRQKLERREVVTIEDHWINIDSQ